MKPGDTAQESVIIPACAECRKHWAETEKWLADSTRVEVAIGGAIGGPIMFAFLWDKIALLPTIVLIILLGIIIFLISFARRPKDRPGHVSGSIAPATADFADGQLKINFANAEFARRFHGEEAAAATPPPPPFRVYSWGSLLGGMVLFAAFGAWTAYICRNGFSWWSIASGWIALGGLVLIFASFSPEPPGNDPKESPSPKPPLPDT